VHNHRFGDAGTDRHFGVEACKWILKHHLHAAARGPQVGTREFAEVHPIKHDGARGRLHEAQD
jgi:hypothetical protein